MDSPLGPLPERGLHTGQLDMVQKTVEQGKFVKGVRSYYGKGLASTADELQIAKTALRQRLFECGKQIVERPTFSVEVLDPSAPGADEIAAWLKSLPETKPVAESDVEAFKQQVQKEATSLMPTAQKWPRLKSGFTLEQAAVMIKIIYGLRLGSNGVAALLGMPSNPAMVARRFQAMNLQIVGVYEYKLEAAQP